MMVVLLADLAWVYVLNIFNVFLSVQNYERGVMGEFY